MIKYSKCLSEMLFNLFYIYKNIIHELCHEYVSFIVK